MAHTYRSLEEAVSLLLAQFSPSPCTGEVPLSQALNRVCAGDVTAAVDHPPFDRSPLDGYAARSEDLDGASPSSPAVLDVKQRIYAGQVPAGPVQPGTCARIMTGAPIPPGADCVIRQEDTDYGENQVRIFVSSAPHRNICDRGEDLRKGAPILSRGTLLTPAHLGVLAGQGLDRVSVFASLEVGVLATGDELVSPGVPLPPGKIYNSNGTYLSARLCQLGMHPTVEDRGADRLDVLTASLEALLDRCGAVISTGGVSVGEKDLIPAALEALGAQILFHGVAVKPGSPVLAASVRGKPVLCLSGNPFAAAATFEVLARPLLCRLAGWKDPMPRRVGGVLTEPFPKASPGRRLVRARLEGSAVSLPSGEHVSGALSALIGCNCLIDIPAGSPPLSAHTPVEVVLL